MVRRTVVFCRGGPMWPPSPGQPHRVAPTAANLNRGRVYPSRDRKGAGKDLVALRLLTRAALHARPLLTCSSFDLLPGLCETAYNSSAKHPVGGYNGRPEDHFHRLW